MDNTTYKIAIAGLMHDIGKFAERAGMEVSREYGVNNADLYQPFNKVQTRHTHKHALYTAAFIEHYAAALPTVFNEPGWGEGDAFINLAAKHHRPETPLQWVVTVADRVSSGMDRESFDEDSTEIKVAEYRKVRLLPVLEALTTHASRDESRGAYAHHYPLRSLSPEAMFPEQGALPNVSGSDPQQEYAGLFSRFVSDLERLNHRNIVPLWIEHFDTLLMRYASCIPAATVGKVIPDVSLYDHMRTTAALAAAIYRYHAEIGSLSIEDIKSYDDRKFLLVTGDFYGIQDFIFSEGGSTNKAAAKLLRGRSFAVSLLSELAADMVCRRAGLPSLSVAINAAGKFTIIAPNTKAARETVSDVEDTVNRWLVERFYGQTSVGFSAVEACCNDFMSHNYSSLWERVGKASEERKYKKIPLDRFGGVVPGYLESFDNDLHRRLCPFCGKRPSSKAAEDDRLLGDERSACAVCRDHIFLGTSLVKSDRIAIMSPDADVHGVKLLDPLFGAYQVSFEIGGRLGSVAESGQLYKYWIIGNRARAAEREGVAVRFIGGHVPVYSEADRNDDILRRLLHGRRSHKKKDELFDQLMKDLGQPKTFEHIAKMALKQVNGEEKLAGIEALGVLKADLDNLGLLFACGLKHESLSRMATLSRQLDSYFALYLPHVLDSEARFSDIYTVFAGGDDLFLIGPWNRIVDFASFLNDSFRRFACSNKELTISSGIEVCKPGLPVTHFAERAEERLKQAKDGGRDAITLFGETVSWEQMKELAEIGTTLKTWLDRGMINNAMLYRLNELVDMAGRQKKLLKAGNAVPMEELDCLKWKARLKYSLIRNVGRGLKGEDKGKVLDDVGRVALWLDKHGSAMRIPLWQVIYNQR